MNTTNAPAGLINPYAVLIGQPATSPVGAVRVLVTAGVLTAGLTALAGPASASEADGRQPVVSGTTSTQAESGRGASGGPPAEDGSDPSDDAAVQDGEDRTEAPAEESGGDQAADRAPEDDGGKPPEHGQEVAGARQEVQEGGEESEDGGPDADADADADAGDTAGTGTSAPAGSGARAGADGATSAGGATGDVAPDPDDGAEVPVEGDGAGDGPAVPVEPGDDADPPGAESEGDEDADRAEVPAGGDGDRADAGAGTGGPPDDGPADGPDTAPGATDGGVARDTGRGADAGARGQGSGDADGPGTGDPGPTDDRDADGTTGTGVSTSPTGSGEDDPAAPPLPAADADRAEQGGSGPSGSTPGSGSGASVDGSDDRVPSGRADGDASRPLPGTGRGTDLLPPSGRAERPVDLPGPVEAGGPTVPAGDAGSADLDPAGAEAPPAVGLTGTAQEAVTGRPELVPDIDVPQDVSQEVPEERPRPEAPRRAVDAGRQAPPVGLDPTVGSLAPSTGDPLDGAVLGLGPFGPAPELVPEAAGPRVGPRESGLAPAPGGLVPEGVGPVPNVLDVEALALGAPSGPPRTHGTVPFPVELVPEIDAAPVGALLSSPPTVNLLDAERMAITGRVRLPVAAWGDPPAQPVAAPQPPPGAVAAPLHLDALVQQFSTAVRENPLDLVERGPDAAARHRASVSELLDGVVRSANPLDLGRGGSSGERRNPPPPPAPGPETSQLAARVVERRGPFDGGS